MLLFRKIIYCLWLTTGIFVIVASLLRCILSIRYANEVDVSTIWAIRETFVGIICVNAPIIGPWLVKKGSHWAHSITSSRASSDQNSGLPTIITIGQRSMRLGRRKREKGGGSGIDGRTGATGWTTINDSDECVLEHHSDGRGENEHPLKTMVRGEKNNSKTVVASMAASSTTAVNDMA